MRVLTPSPKGEAGLAATGVLAAREEGIAATGVLAALRAGSVRRGRWHPPSARLCALALVAVLLLALSSSALAAAVPSASAQSASPLPHYAVRMTRNVAYGPRPEETIDLCEPIGARGPLPVVIAIHGGAWVAGDKAGWAGRCRFFAALGFAAAVIDYRLAPRAVWPAQLEDAQLAVRYLRANAAPLDLNPRAICALGESAGGQLALFLGSLATTLPGDAAALYPDQSPRVACVIDEYGPTDLLRPMPLLDNAAILLLLGGTSQARKMSVRRAASPIFSVSPDSAPTLIVQGNADTTVPPEQSRLMAAALRRVGVAVAYVSYPGGHSLSGLNAAGRAAIAHTEALWLLRWYSSFR